MQVVGKIETVGETGTKGQPLAAEEETINCAQCNHPVTDPSCQITVDDAFVHVFANPHGHVFEIGCFSQADGCNSGSPDSTEFTWFAGFSWQVGICSHCHSHLGWIFTSEVRRFYGLILDRLIFP